MPTPSVVLLTFGNPGAARYKPDEFIPLGRLIDVTRVFVSRADSGIKSLEDAKTIEATHGTMPPGSSPHIVAWAANEVIGTKFRVVPGYSGGGPLFVALEQGEIQVTTIVGRWRGHGRLAAAAGAARRDAGPHGHHLG